MHRMIKKTLLLYLICLSTTLFAQQDSSAYNAQRNKINDLLDQRSAKFGQYEESLNMRTGIFGFQTKRDIKNSNEILRDIAINDNNIFKELKVLLDYKDLQVQQVKTTVNTSTDRIQAYMITIKKLQDQNELLKEELKSQKHSNQTITFILFFLILTASSATYILYKRLKKRTN